MQAECYPMVDKWIHGVYQAVSHVSGPSYHAHAHLQPFFKQLKII